MESEGQPWFRRHARTILALAFLLLLAAFFRVAFNYGPATTDGEYRFQGNDDYYHHRVVHHIQTEGSHLINDPLLNYPVGAANPRPPVYNWHVAMAGRVAEAFGMTATEASAYTLLWGSAFWGILTVIPIFLTGRFLYSNRAGLWGGFLIATSPAHIQRGGFGLGDHDAFIIFFLALGFYFLVRALRLTRDDTRVESWSSVRSIARGFGHYVDSHREGLAYAFLAGMCFVVIALAWEGYPYVTAIYGVYFAFQMLTNQLRRRDSTGDILVMVIILGLLTFVPLPYYWTVGVTIHKTVIANTYILGGLVLISLLLAPTRDYPSVLVLPSIAALGVVSWAFLRFVVPDIGQTIFTANGYFNQSKVYSTIAEAQRTDLGFFVFSIGFMTFFLAIVGFVYATVRFFKRRERDQLFIVGWGLVSIYMAFAATRFVFNAAPVFAILGGWMVDKLVGWMNWRERLRDFRSLRHESWGKAVKSVMGGKQIMGALFLGLTLIVPNVWFSFDAGLPTETRQEWARDSEFIRQQTGAFGSGFLGQDWITVYTWLAEQNEGRPCDQRPGHMAWWDYGFWEVAIACHPTVADNFQNGVQISGAWLTAQSEKESVEWMTVRLIEGAYRRNGNTFPQPLLDVLRQHDPELPQRMPAGVFVSTYQPLRNAIADATPDLDAAVDLYRDVSAATGSHIGYFLADLRMLPFDDPRTPRIDSQSIFYAPTYLANKNPDDFVQTVYEAQGGTQYRVVNYYVDAQGVSRALPRPNIVGPDERLYLITGQSIVRTLDGVRLDYSHNNGEGVRLERAFLDLKPAFYQTMFYRSYVGGDGRPPGGGQNYHDLEPGHGLRHYRLVKQGNENPQANTVQLLEFFYGAVLEGRVATDGAAMENVSVIAYDDLGIPHDQTVTDASGNYRLLLPFGLQNATTGAVQPTTVRFVRGGVEIADLTFQVTRGQAAREDAFTQRGDLNVQPGALEVFAFIDRNRDGAYNATVDRPAEGATVSVGGRNVTVGPDGLARFEGLMPGSEAITGALENYVAQSAEGAVRSGTTARANLSFMVQSVAVNGTAVMTDGSPAVGLPVSVVPVNPAEDFTQPGASPRTSENGTFATVVYPGGKYRFFINDTRSEEDGNWTYRSDVVEVDIQPGRDQPLVELRVTRARAD